MSKKVKKPEQAAVFPISPVFAKMMPGTDFVSYMRQQAVELLGFVHHYHDVLEEGSGAGNIGIDRRMGLLAHLSSIRHRAGLIKKFSDLYPAVGKKNPVVASIMAQVHEASGGEMEIAKRLRAAAETFASDKARYFDKNENMVPVNVLYVPGHSKKREWSENARAQTYVEWLLSDIKKYHDIVHRLSKPAKNTPDKKLGGKFKISAEETKAKVLHNQHLMLDFVVTQMNEYALLYKQVTDKNRVVEAVFKYIQGAQATGGDVRAIAEGLKKASFEHDAWANGFFQFQDATVPKPPTRQGEPIPGAE